MDTNSISELLNSVSPEELERLKSVAQNLISSGAVGGGKGQNENSSKPSAASEKTGGGILTGG